MAYPSMCRHLWFQPPERLPGLPLMPEAPHMPRKSGPSQHAPTLAVSASESLPPTVRECHAYTTPENPVRCANGPPRRLPPLSDTASPATPSLPGFNFGRLRPMSEGDALATPSAPAAAALGSRKPKSHACHARMTVARGACDPFPFDAPRLPRQSGPRRMQPGSASASAAAALRLLMRHSWEGRVARGACDPFRCRPPPPLP